jgi:hypothetical protein
MGLNPAKGIVERVLIATDIDTGAHLSRRR